MATEGRKWEERGSFGFTCNEVFPWNSVDERVDRWWNDGDVWENAAVFRFGVRIGGGQRMWNWASRQ